MHPTIDPTTLTLGIEEELHVVDLATGDLVPRADEVIRAVRPVLGPLVTCELNLCQIETATPVCTTLSEAAGHLAEGRRAMAEAAASIGLGVVAVATHPTGRWQDQRIDRDQPRFRALEETYQELARQQVICGCHVHVGIPDRDERIRVLAHLRPWLSVLFALSANSPRWEGHDTGYASFRHQVWRRWPTAGPPPPLTSAAHYDALVEDLVASGAVPDASYLYWDARPSLRHPTVEVRSIDTCLLVDDAVAIAGLVRALVWTALAEVRAGRPAPDCEPAVLDAAMWRASRYGIDGTLLSPHGGSASAAQVVGLLLEHCERGLAAHGDRDAVRSAVEDLILRGTGATEQRALLASARDPLAELMAVTAGTRPLAGAEVA
jgi:carboxylate-amine ligase